MTDNRPVLRLAAAGIPRGSAAFLVALGILACLALARAQSPAPDPAATMFEKQCYSCHNIGGGKKKGPDLKGVTDRRNRAWLHKFIAAPKDMRNSGDATAVSLFKEFAPEEMPDQLLSPDQIDQLLGLIERVSKSGKAFVPQSGRLARPVRPGDSAAGYRYFTGSRRLAKGGPACISCHSVQGGAPLGGGTMGPDLTQANLRYTDIELASILKAPAFPTMSRMFANNGLTDEEVVQVFAYLQAVRQRNPDPGRYGLGFVLLGMAGTAVTVGLMNHIWRRRLRGGVRRAFVRQAVAQRQARVRAASRSDAAGLDA